MLLSPSVALANMGTPLMWAGAFHLLIGNALIGVIEGQFISRLFGVRRRRAIGLLIAANYFSAWIGALAFGESEAFALFGGQLLYRLGSAYAGFIFISFATTILLEWPFVAFALRGQARLIPRSLGASAMAQVVSYALLVPGFYAVSSTSLLGEVTRDPGVVASAGHDGEIYFVGPEGDGVYRCFLDGSAATKVAALPPAMGRALLYPALGDDGKSWDLRVEAREGSSYRGTGDVLLRGIARRPADESGTQSPVEPAQWRAGPSTWSPPFQGLVASNRVSGEKYRIQLETPLLTWSTRQVNRIPGERVVFQLGSYRRGQIVLLELPTRRLGLVTLGSSPVVVWEGVISCDGCSDHYSGECPQWCWK